MANYRVLKQFSGDRVFRIGETVSLDGRNVQKLIDLRYLALADGEPAPQPVVAQEPGSPPAPKRGRGRPRKNPAPAPAPV